MDNQYQYQNENQNRYQPPNVAQGNHGRGNRLANNQRSNASEQHYWDQVFKQKI